MDYAMDSGKEMKKDVAGVGSAGDKAIERRLMHRGRKSVDFPVIGAYAGY